MITQQMALPGTPLEYLKTISPARRRLLSYLDLIQLPALRSKLARCIKNNATLECGLDEGLADGIATMGFVVTDGTDVLCKGAGPVDGEVSTANSRRSELFGFAALCDLILCLQNLYSQLLSTALGRVAVRIWVDSTNAIKQFNRVLQGKRSHQFFPYDADILVHIEWLVRQLTVWDIKVEWVKAHQDANVDRETLPLNARINILADKLATSYRTTVKAPGKQPRAQASFFPAAKVSLLVNGRRVTSQYGESIRFHVNGTTMRKFLQDTRQWDNSICNIIDMESIGAAIQKLTAARRVGVSKMMYGWNNTGWSPA
jgi:hypothetical protein